MHIAYLTSQNQAVLVKALQVVANEFPGSKRCVSCVAAAFGIRRLNRVEQVAALTVSELGGWTF